MQAKDIPDALILRVIYSLQGLPHPPPWPQDTNQRHERWVSTWHIEASLAALMSPPPPDKVVHAKLKALYRRKILDGCPCGCRGDWHFRKQEDAEGLEPIAVRRASE